MAISVEEQEFRADLDILISTGIFFVVHLPHALPHSVIIIIIITANFNYYLLKYFLCICY